MTTTMVRRALKATGLRMLGVGSDGRGAYVDYVAPGIMLLAVAGAAQGTAISVAWTCPKASSPASARWASLAPRC
jgi:hypothetical protein